jgi:membrane-associated phospholipid phosphatase
VDTRSAIARILLVAFALPLPALAQSFERPVSWKLLPSNLLSDQKKIWLFPTTLRRPRNWIAPAAVVGATALLIAEADPPEASYFRRTSSFHGFNRVFSGTNTALGMVLFPASFYVTGLVRKDSKAQRVALLAGEAVLDSEILTTVMKDIGRRQFPVSVPPQQGFSDTWFKTTGHWVRGSGSFPSGHSIAAFSVATVFAREYGRRHRWVPYVAYGAAALVGLSRLPLLSHYTSDVFMGGALGYSIARFAVLR